MQKENVRIDLVITFLRHSYRQTIIIYEIYISIILGQLKLDHYPHSLFLVHYDHKHRVGQCTTLVGINCLLIQQQ